MTQRIRRLDLLRTLLLLVLLPAAQLAAQVNDTATASPATGDSTVSRALVPRSGARHPGKAAVLGILHPGLGLYYAGEYERGFRVQMVSIGSFVAAIALSTPPSLTSPGSESRRTRDLRITGAVVAGAVGLASWVYGAVEAPRAARRRDRCLTTGYGCE